MKRECPQSITCPGLSQLDADSPITNYSAEYTDGPQYFAQVFYQAWGNCPSQYCTSTISQADADACAQRLSQTCNDGSDVFYNSAITETTVCPDGSPGGTITVPAGTFAASTQIAADNLAQQQAALLAQTGTLCPTGPVGACLNLPYSSAINVPGSSGLLTFVVASGSLPPGLVIIQTDDRTATISGTPTVSGTYAFTIKISDASGTTTSRDYSIAVIGITNTAAIPAGIVGTAYDFQLAVSSNISSPYAFTIESGSLPEGLSIDATGHITGTPTKCESPPFTIRLQEHIGSPCLYPLLITIGSTFPWNGIVWDRRNSGSGVVTSYGTIGGEVGADGCPTFHFHTDDTDGSSSASAQAVLTNGQGCTYFDATHNGLCPYNNSNPVTSYLHIEFPTMQPSDPFEVDIVVSQGPNNVLTNSGWIHQCFSIVGAGCYNRASGASFNSPAFTIGPSSDGIVTINISVGATWNRGSVINCTGYIKTGTP